MFIRTAIAVFVAATIIEAGTAFAQTAPAPPAPPAAGAPAAGHHRGFARLLRDLNLTPDQQAKIDAIQAKYRAQNQNTTDRSQWRANRQAQRQEIFAVLTPDQRAKLDAKIKQMRERARNGENAPGAPVPKT